MHTKAEAVEVNEFARQVFEKDGNHVPIVILYNGDKKIVLPVQSFMQSGETKEYLSAVIRKSIHEFEVSGVVFITEAWMTVGKLDDEIVSQLKKGEKRVSELATKKEVLMVKAESDDGLNITFMNYIERDTNGKPTLKEAEELNELNKRQVIY